MMEKVKLFERLTDMEQLLRDFEDENLMALFNEIIDLIGKVQENANTNYNKLLDENRALTLGAKSSVEIANQLFACEQFSSNIQVEEQSFKAKHDAIPYQRSELVADPSDSRSQKDHQNNEYRRSVRKCFEICDSLIEVLGTNISLHSCNGTSKLLSSSGPTSTVGIMVNDLTVDGMLIGGPAYNSKMLRKGDKIVKVDGIEVSMDNLQEVLVGDDVPGSEVILTVEKQDLMEIVEVTLRRVARTEMAERIELFECFADIKENAIVRDNKEIIFYVDNCVCKFTNVLMEQNVRDQHISSNLKKLKNRSLELISQLLQEIHLFKSWPRILNEFEKSNVALRHEIQELEDEIIQLQKDVVTVKSNRDRKMRMRLMQANRETEDTRTSQVDCQAKLSKMEIENEILRKKWEECAKQYSDNLNTCQRRISFLETEMQTQEDEFELYKSNIVVAQTSSREDFVQLEQELQSLIADIRVSNKDQDYFIEAFSDQLDCLSATLRDSQKAVRDLKMMMRLKAIDMVKECHEAHRSLLQERSDIQARIQNSKSVCLSFVRKLQFHSLHFSFSIWQTFFESRKTVKLMQVRNILKKEKGCNYYSKDKFFLLWADLILQRKEVTYLQKKQKSRKLCILFRHWKHKCKLATRNQIVTFRFQCKNQRNLANKIFKVLIKSIYLRRRVNRMRGRKALGLLKRVLSNWICFSQRNWMEEMSFLHITSKAGSNATRQALQHWWLKTCRSHQLQQAQVVTAQKQTCSRRLGHFLRWKRHAARSSLRKSAAQRLQLSRRVRALALACSIWFSGAQYSRRTNSIGRMVAAGQSKSRTKRLLYRWSLFAKQSKGVRHSESQLIAICEKTFRTAVFESWQHSVGEEKEEALNQRLTLQINRIQHCVCRGAYFLQRLLASSGMAQARCIHLNRDLKHIANECVQLRDSWRLARAEDSSKEARRSTHIAQVCAASKKRRMQAIVVGAWCACLRAERKQQKLLLLRQIRRGRASVRTALHALRDETRRRRDQDTLRQVSTSMGEFQLELEALREEARNAKEELFFKTRYIFLLGQETNRCRLSVPAFTPRRACDSARHNALDSSKLIKVYEDFEAHRRKHRVFFQWLLSCKESVIHRISLNGRQTEQQDIGDADR
eukprot:759506-Hanusia_phi.AAC.4